MKNTHLHQLTRLGPLAQLRYVNGWTIVVLSLLTTCLQAQKSYYITYTGVPPGLTSTSDSLWSTIPVADGFTTTLPAYGRDPKQPTTVRMTRDNHAMYILANCQSDHVRDDGSLRDDWSTADYFSVGFDTWHDRQNAFVFTVTASGQQVDQRITGSQTETRFDVRWFSTVKRTDAGWTVLIKIPFTALRYPAHGEQNWGLQFTRFDRSTGETTVWNPQNPLITDQVRQFGELQGLGTIKNDLRVGLSVYGDMGKTTSQFQSDRTESTTTSRPSGFGLDARVGINPATTLDVTVLPGIMTIENKDIYPGYNDIRITPYPTPQNRPFLMEERAGFRRAGAFEELPVFQPYWYQIFAGNYWGQMKDANVLNSTKLVTQTKKNVRLGMHNSIYSKATLVHYSPTIGVKKIGAKPVVNYVFAEKLFKNNGFIHLDMTNALLHESLRYRQLAAAGQIRDRSNRFELKGNYTRVNQSAHDSFNLVFPRTEGRIALSKINGKWTGGFEYQTPKQILADSFIPPQFTDLRNIHSLKAQINRYNYQCRSPFWLNNSVHLAAIHFWGANPEQGKSEFDSLKFWVQGLNRRFQTFKLSAGVANFKGEEYIYFDLLELTQSVKYPVAVSAEFVSDSRKRFVWSTGASLSKYINTDQYQNSLWGAFRYTPSKIIQINYRLQFLNRGEILAQDYDQNSKNYVYYYNNLDIFSNINLLFQYNKNVVIEAGLDIMPKSRQYQIEQYELTSSYNLIPATFPINKNPATVVTTPHFTIHYFSGNTHLALRYNRQNTENYYYTPEVIRSTYTRSFVSMSFIWTIQQDSAPFIKKRLQHR